MRAFCLAVALGATLTMPTWAQRAMPGTGGSVPLTEVLAVAAKYPNLVQQIRLQLLAAGQSKASITCAADRFSSEWGHLGGKRVAPYVCVIGKRTLRISAVPTYYDRNGHRVKPDDANIRATAARVVETGLRWQWQ